MLSEEGSRLHELRLLLRCPGRVWEENSRSLIQCQSVNSSHGDRGNSSAHLSLSRTRCSGARSSFTASVRFSSTEPRPKWMVFFCVCVFLNNVKWFHRGRHECRAARRRRHREKSLFSSWATGRSCLRGVKVGGRRESGLPVRFHNKRRAFAVSVISE